MNCFTFFVIARPPIEVEGRLDGVIQTKAVDPQVKPEDDDTECDF